MARIFDERFEGVGYEEDGWDEYNELGSYIDQDADTADVGSPSDWGDQCCKIYCVGNIVEAYNSIGAEPITHWRVNLIVTAEDLNDGENLDLVGWWTNGNDGPLLIILLNQNGGILTFSINSKHDGSSHFYNANTIVTLNTRYRIEVKWDATNNKWGWKIDGVVQPNDQDDSHPITADGNLTDTHLADAGQIVLGTDEDGKDYTCYYDLVACDDADWVGAEGEARTPTGILPAMAGALARKLSADRSPKGEI